MPAIDPITVPVTMSVTNAAPLRAVTDALTDLATAIRNMLDDQAEPEPGLTIHIHGAIPDKDTVADMVRRAAARADARRHLVHARSTHRDDIGAEVAECLVDYLEASLCGNGPSPDTTQDIVERILAACGVPADPELTAEPRPDAPIDLDSLGLGAVVRAKRVGATRGVSGGVWVLAAATGDPAWVFVYPSIIGVSVTRAKHSDLTDVEVLHPGITIGGEDA